MKAGIGIEAKQKYPAQWTGWMTGWILYGLEKASVMDCA